MHQGTDFTSICNLQDCSLLPINNCTVIAQNSIVMYIAQSNYFIDYERTSA